MTEPEEWQVDVSYASRSIFKKFNRNHPLEYSSCYVLGIGTKETQKSDIIDAKKLIKRIKSSD